MGKIFRSTDCNFESVEILQLSGGGQADVLWEAVEWDEFVGNFVLRQGDDPHSVRVWANLTADGSRHDKLNLKWKTRLIITLYKGREKEVPQQLFS